MAGGWVAREVSPCQRKELDIDTGDDDYDDPFISTRIVNTTPWKITIIMLMVVMVMIMATKTNGVDNGFWPCQNYGSNYHKTGNEPPGNSPKYFK